MPTRIVALAQVAARDLSDAAVALDEAVTAVRAAGAAGADLCVLPEGTYPAYVLGSADAAQEALASGPDAPAILGAEARRAGLELVAGLVVESPDGLLNAAFHFGRDGEVRNRVAKRFLWHFDNAWFVAGGRSAVVDGLGVLVCADGRLPEIAGDLASQGAGLLVNSTAWVVSQPSPTGTNVQAEFLWRVRALEWGCAAVACTKVGTEAGLAMYAGKSQAIASDGTVMAMASPTEPELLVCELEVPTAGPAERSAAPSARAGGRSRSEVAAPRAPDRVDGVAVIAVATAAELLTRAGGLVCNLLVGPNGVVESRGLEVATLYDDDMLSPWPARDAAFAGAHVVEEIARARALENRVFVAVWRPVDDGPALVVGPSGAVVARAPAGASYVTSTAIVPAEASVKELVPGTDVFAGAVALRSDDG
jgi:predicted amidohydrolase